MITICSRLKTAIVLLLLIMSMASCERGYLTLGTSPQVLSKWINIVGLNDRQVMQIYDQISSYLAEQNFKEQVPTEADCRIFSGQKNPCYVHVFSKLEKEGSLRVGIFLYVDAHRQKVVAKIQETEASSPVPEGPTTFSPEACNTILNMTNYVISLPGVDKLAYGYNGVASNSEPSLNLQKYIGCT